MLVYQLSVHDKWSISMILQKKPDCHHPPAQALYLNSTEGISLQSNASCVSQTLNPFQWCHECTPRMEEHHLSLSSSSQLVYQFLSLFTNFWLSSVWSGNSLLPPVPWLMVPSEHNQTAERDLPALQSCPASLKSCTFLTWLQWLQERIDKKTAIFCYN